MSSHRKRRRVSFPRAQRLQITFSLFIADLDICVRVRERGQQKNLAAMSMVMMKMKTFPLSSSFASLFFVNKFLCLIFEKQERNQLQLEMMIFFLGTFSSVRTFSPPEEEKNYNKMIAKVFFPLFVGEIEIESCFGFCFFSSFSVLRREIINMRR